MANLNDTNIKGNLFVGGGVSLDNDYRGLGIKLLWENTVLGSGAFDAQTIILNSDDWDILVISSSQYRANEDNKTTHVITGLGHHKIVNVLTSTNSTYVNEVFQREFYVKSKTQISVGENIYSCKQTPGYAINEVNVPLKIWGIKIM